MAAKVTIDQIKELRDRTGAGLMNCKEALIEADADIEKAIDILREKGIAKAAKKAGRVAAEGLALVKTGEGKAVVAEINCETDFVSSSDKFHEFTAKVMDELFAKGCKTLEEAQEATKDLFAEATIAMGEKFLLRRYAFLELKDGEAFGSYIHMGGKIGVMVEASNGASEEVVHDVALQIAAANAQYVNRDEVPASEVEHEKEILKAQAMNEDSKKPEAIIEKMLVGRINKFYKEVCLNEQVFVKNPDITIAQYLKQNGDVTVIRFTRYAMGEGLQKREDDFVGEVMAQAHLNK